MRTLTDHTPPPPADPFARIQAALDEIATQITAAIAIPHGSDRDNAHRAALLARLHTRQAAWWRVLARTGCTSTAGVPLVFVRAAHHAASEARGNARFWRDITGDWTARAERRPTSDAAGALSNWDELGVTA